MDEKRIRCSRPLIALRTSTAVASAVKHARWECSSATRPRLGFASSSPAGLLRHGGGGINHKPAANAQFGSAVELRAAEETGTHTPTTTAGLNG